MTGAAYSRGPETPLVAGRELDALVAERVMGIVPCGEWRYANMGSAGGPISMNDGCEHGRGGCYPADHSLPFGGPAHYSTDIAAAWLVVEKMRERLWHVLIDDNHWDGSADALGGGWYVLLTHRDDRTGDERLNVARSNDSFPLAICLAALKAVGVT